MITKQTRQALTARVNETQTAKLPVEGYIKGTGRANLMHGGLTVRTADGLWTLNVTPSELGNEVLRVLKANNVMVTFSYSPINMGRRLDQ